MHGTDLLQWQHQLAAPCTEVMCLLLNDRLLLDATATTLPPVPTCRRGTICSSAGLKASWASMEFGSSKDFLGGSSVRKKRSTPAEGPDFLAKTTLQYIWRPQGEVTQP